MCPVKLLYDIEVCRLKSKKKAMTCNIWTYNVHVFSYYFSQLFIICGVLVPSGIFFSTWFNVNTFLYTSNVCSISCGMIFMFDCRHVLVQYSTLKDVNTAAQRFFCNIFQFLNRILQLALVNFYLQIYDYPCESIKRCVDFTYQIINELHVQSSQSRCKMIVKYEVQIIFPTFARDLP